MQENADQINSEYGHFLPSESFYSPSFMSGLGFCLGLAFVSLDHFSENSESS